MADGESDAARLILVLGILGRSGTNFLRDLLLLHPDCSAPAAVPEDHLLHHAGELDQYCRRVTEHWTDPGAKADLLEAAGRAAAGELLRRGGSTQRLVTKTPSVRNLGLLQAVFPGARTLVIVRDGRDVAESYVRSFNANYEGVFHRWRDAAREILAHSGTINETAEIEGNGFHIVRYEDLANEPRRAVVRVLREVGLDPAVFDFDRLESIPVRGSSDRMVRDGDLHWKPAARDPDFAPVARWSGWEPRRLARFAWLAADEMRLLGYQMDDPVGSPYRMMNRAQDVAWAALEGSRLVPTARAMVERLGLQGKL